MASFKRNSRFEKKFAESDEFRAGMGEIAAGVARAVADNAPVNTQAYQRSIKSFVEADKVGVESTDPFAHLVEFGSTNNPAYAPLRRGVRAAGLRLDPSPKQ